MHGSFRGVFFDFPPNLKLLSLIYMVYIWCIVQSNKIGTCNVKIDFQICQILERGYRRRPAAVHVPQLAKIKASMYIDELLLICSVDVGLIFYVFVDTIWV